VVWQSLSELLRTPTVIPPLHHSWAQAKQQSLTTLTAQQEQVLQRKQRAERQVQRLLDAYQAEVITLSELQLRRQKLNTELHHLDHELHQLTQTHQQTTHWQQVIDNTERFRQLLGDNLERLSFEDRQTVVQCLIKKVVVTGEQVDISYVLPFDQAPQVYNSSSQQPEGTPGQFYRLRLADLPGKGLARYLSQCPARFQPLPIGTAREVFPQAARPVGFTTRVMGQGGAGGDFH
jgi:hypothetical protein